MQQTKVIISLRFLWIFGLSQKYKKKKENKEIFSHQKSKRLVSQAITNKQTSKNEILHLGGVKKHMQKPSPQNPWSYMYP